MGRFDLDQSLLGIMAPKRAAMEENERADECPDFPNYWEYVFLLIGGRGYPSYETLWTGICHSTKEKNLIMQVSVNM